MEKQLKEIIRSVVKEDFMNEMSRNDVHVKEIMKFYDKGSSNAKKALSLYLLRKPNATRNQILDELGDYGYNDVWEVMDHFKLTLESVNEAAPIYKDWDEFVKPNYILVTLKNGKKLKIDKHNYKGSDSVYQAILKAFNDNNHKITNKVVSGMLDRLGESVTETTINEGFGDSIKKIRSLAIKMASTKYNTAKSHLNIDKIASADKFDGSDAMNKATAALLQQNDLDEDLKSTINNLAVKLGTGATMLGIITALVSMAGWIQYLDSSFTKWYYTEIQKLAEPEVMKVMQDMGRAGQAEGSIYGKLGMYAFFIFFTIAVISLVAARMTQGTKNEYVDDKGVEHVAAALPQTEEEPVTESLSSDIKNAKNRLKDPHTITNIQYKKTSRGDKYIQINYKKNYVAGKMYDPEGQFVSIFYGDDKDLVLIGKELKLKLKESVNEALVKGKTYGGSKCEGGCFMGKEGLKKILKISKESPNNVFMFRDDNYSGLQPHFIKNGVIAKANTIGNPSYDLDRHKVRNLNIGKDVILSIRLFESVNECKTC